MMDERIKETFHKIYAELFHLVMIGCCISVIVKLAFLGMDAVDCIPEYPILVGSPLYLAVRTRMLGVTQLPAPGDKKKNRRILPLVCGLFVALMVFTAISRNHGDPVDLGKCIAFIVPFIVCFIAVQAGYRKLEERRQKKLDSKYED